MDKDLGKTSTGLQANIAGLACYVIGFVSGVVFLLLEKENKFVRFHAMQSIVTFGAIAILQCVFLSMFYPLVALLSLASLGLWIVLIIKAYQGEMFKLPVLGDFAEKCLAKIKF